MFDLIVPFDVCILQLDDYTSSNSFNANVERQLERQAMDAPNCFPSMITFRWSYKVS